MKTSDRTAAIATWVVICALFILSTVSDCFAQWTWSSGSGPNYYSDPVNTTDSGNFGSAGTYYRSTVVPETSTFTHGTTPWPWVRLDISGTYSAITQCAIGCNNNGSGPVHTNAYFEVGASGTWSWPSGSSSTTVSNHVNLPGFVKIEMAADTSSLAWGFAWAASGTNGAAPYDWSRAIANGTNTEPTGLDGFSPASAVGTWNDDHLNGSTTGVGGYCNGNPNDTYTWTDLQDSGSFVVTLDNAYNAGEGLTSLIVYQGVNGVTTNNVTGTGQASATSQADVRNGAYIISYLQN